MEQASFRESIEFYGQAFGSSSSCASAQPASPSGDNLGGWRNAIHFRINSTMQKIATVGSSQANRIRTLFITFAFAMVQTVLSLVDSGTRWYSRWNSSVYTTFVYPWHWNNQFSSFFLSSDRSPICDQAQIVR
jgi:hypothetical protein